MCLNAMSKAKIISSVQFSSVCVCVVCAQQPCQHCVCCCIILLLVVVVEVVLDANLTRLATQIITIPHTHTNQQLQQQNCPNVY